MLGEYSMSGIFQPVEMSCHSRTKRRWKWTCVATSLVSEVAFKTQRKGSRCFEGSRRKRRFLWNRVAGRPGAKGGKEGTNLVSVIGKSNDPSIIRRELVSPCSVKSWRWLEVSWWNIHQADWVFFGWDWCILNILVKRTNVRMCSRRR